MLQLFIATFSMSISVLPGLDLLFIYDNPPFQELILSVYVHPFISWNICF